MRPMIEHLSVCWTHWWWQEQLSNMLFDGAAVAMRCLLFICALQHEDRVINFESGAELDAQNLNNV